MTDKQKNMSDEQIKRYRDIGYERCARALTSEYGFSHSHMVGWKKL